MRQRILLAAMLVVFCLGGLTTANAIVLVDSGAPPGPTFTGSDVYAGQFRAQQFTLPIAAWITEIAPFMGRKGDQETGPDPVVKVQVTNAIGPGTPSSALLAEFSLTLAGPPTVFIPIATSFFLDAGTFYLVLSSAAALANSVVWTEGAPVDIGPDFVASGASVDSTSPPASAFGGDVGASPGLRISGGPVPEPGTLLLVGSGLAGVGAWRARRRKGKG